MHFRPQTLYGLADSPVGLASWILDHDYISLALITRVFDGQTEGLSRDDILDNITFYWLTYPKLIHYNKLDKGRHFAAWEQPKFLSEEVRAGFRPLRKSS
jgi:hypothetical protein